MSDFRSNPMPTPDGLSRAKNNFQKAWAAYAKAIGPASMAFAKPIAHGIGFDLYGFWLLWHLHGGFEGLQSPMAEGGLGMSRSAVYRRISMFRRMTGKHPDEFEIPGLTIDLETYFKSSIPKDGDTPK